MAAEDTKGKKRKGASDAAPKAKKARKSDDVAAAPKPVKAAKSAPAPAKTRSSRQQAADFFSDDEAPAAEPALAKAKNTKKNAKGADAPVEEEPKVEEKPKKQGKKTKAAPVEETPVVEAPKEKAKKASKSKKAAAAPVEEEPVTEAVEDAPSKKSKKAKTIKKVVEAVEPEVEADEVDLDADEDDQTAALLAGFESEGDEEDPEDDDGFDKKKLTGKGFIFSKEDKAIMEFAEKHSTETGVVYVGRIPRGFFEPQMKKYFSQFGRVRRLRLSRNKKTGAPKHFAFVEFASPEVADIVARTMDNYLLFGHILKCKVIPNEQVHADMFKGAGERFKVDPRNKKAGLEMERGVDRAQWDKRVEKENKRRIDKADALKEDFGYEFKAPKVKSTKHVPAKLENGDAQKLEDAEPEETATIEEPKPKRGKKAAAAKEEAPVEALVEKKAAKSKKLKSDVVPETVEKTPEKKRKAKAETEAAKPKKAKKAKA